LIHPEILRACALLSDEKEDRTVSWLYENWWSGVPGDLIRRTPNTLHHPEVLGRFLFQNANSQVFSVGFGAIRLEAGEFYYIEKRTVIIKRLKQWTEEPWFWIQGVTLPKYPKGIRTLRVYLPTCTDQPFAVAKKLGAALDHQLVPFQMKTRTSEGTFHDQTVLWIDALDLQSVLFEIEKIGLSTLRLPPPATAHVHGVGIADHPRNGDSLGWKMCQAIWSSVRLNSAQTLPRQFEQLGLNPQRPWLLLEYDNEPWEVALD
jgi:hypothetical protein